MRELMPSNADHSPVSKGLREVFHIDAAGDVAVGAGRPSPARLRARA